MVFFFAINQTTKLPQYPKLTLFINFAFLISLASSNSQKSIEIDS